MDTSSGQPASGGDHGGSSQNVALELQNLLLGAARVEEFLAEVARLAAGSLERAQACGLVVQATEHSRMLAAPSDEFAARMDEVQYAVDDGPCLHCLRENEVVLVEDVAADRRWPAFSRRGESVGAGAALSVPLRVGERTVGALNLYSRRVRGLDEEDERRAHRFAGQAAGAVALAARLAERERRERHLETALTSRSVVDQAIGVVMERAGVNAERAFGILRQRSQDANMTLRDVAAGILAELDP